MEGTSRTLRFPKLTARPLPSKTDVSGGGLIHLVLLRCWIMVNTKLTRKTRSIKMMLKAMAMPKSPLLTSITVAVVKTRVCPEMLPPTIMEAPTSEIIAPKPAMTAASSGSRVSFSSNHSIWVRVAPRA